MAVTVDLPETVEQALKERWGEARLSRKTLEALLIEAYREGLLSRGKLGELLGLGFQDREAFLNDRGVAYNYDLQDFEQDLHTMDELLGKPAATGKPR